MFNGLSFPAAHFWVVAIGGKVDQQISQQGWTAEDLPYRTPELSKGSKGAPSSKVGMGKTRLKKIMRVWPYLLTKGVWVNTQAKSQSIAYNVVHSSHANQEEFTSLKCDLTSTMYVWVNDPDAGYKSWQMQREKTSSCRSWNFCWSKRPNWILTWFIDVFSYRSFQMG